MLTITGRIFTVHKVNDKLIQIVLQKQVRGKKVLIAIDAFGFLKDKVDALKLNKNEKVKITFTLQSNLYKDKFYPNIKFLSVERFDIKNNDEQEEIGIGNIRFYDENGNILL